MTTLSGTPANKLRGRVGILFSGMVTTISSPLWAASVGDTGVAPVSLARLASDSGPRELATKTLWPRAARRRVRALPIWPAPIMPTFMVDSFGGAAPQRKLASDARQQRLGALMGSGAIPRPLQAATLGVTRPELAGRRRQARPALME